MKQFTDEEILEKVRKLRDLLNTFSILTQQWWLTLLFGVGPALFNLWKKIVNLKPFADLQFPEPTPAMVFYLIESIEGLKEKYEEQLGSERRNEEDFQLLRPIYLDLTYCTSFKILKEKYPEVPEEYLEKQSRENLDFLGRCVEIVKQEVSKTDLDPGHKGELFAVLDFFKECLPYLDFIKDEDKGKYKEILELIESLGGE